MRRWLAQILAKIAYWLCPDLKVFYDAWLHFDSIETERMSAAAKVLASILCKYEDTASEAVDPLTTFRSLTSDEQTAIIANAESMMDADNLPKRTLGDLQNYIVTATDHYMQDATNKSQTS